MSSNSDFIRVVLYYNGRKVEGRRSVIFVGEKRPPHIKRNSTVEELHQKIRQKLCLKDNKSITLVTTRLWQSEQYISLQVVDDEDVDMFNMSEEDEHDPTWVMDDDYDDDDEENIAMEDIFLQRCKLRKWGGDHNCLNDHISQDHRQLNSDMIASLTVETIKKKPSVSTALVQERITHSYGFKVSYRKAWYAKQKAMAMLYGDWEESQCCEAFNICKPMIQIDGIHLYEKYKGKLLIATAQDGNNECLPLAFAIVDAVENHPGLLPPHAFNVYCLRYIASNFNQRFINDKLKAALINIGYAPCMVDFERALARIRDTSSQVADWIDGIPKKKWSRAHNVEGRRYGHMTTNLSQSVNRVLKGARNMPITGLVKHMYSRLVHYFAQKVQSASQQVQSDHSYCKNVIDSLTHNESVAIMHNVRIYNVEETVFEVDAGWKRSYSVNLRERSCQCRQFKAFKYPYSHAATAALHIRRNPR
ncbi:uncharacterized protein LOC133305938 [Gastrolobium bilobum]|uniref:uncharacterized protein LOC133305938 n=1 Tax=Gastrolobium bilobum TaxID=150636 RepID=UPI002AB101A9|nr:uncharacterized protein LOC133305938 [Gastrolobium bilobum]